MNAQNKTIEVGSIVSYKSGASIYTGIVVKMPTDAVPCYVIVDDAAGMELHNAGFAVGSCVVAEQFVQPTFELYCDGFKDPKTGTLDYFIAIYGRKIVESFVFRTGHWMTTFKPTAA